MHEYYSKVTRKEKVAIDDAARAVFKAMNASGVPLVGDDRAERFVDAIARAVIESRGMPVRKGLAA